ncbi:hypothetical protein Ancab_018917 [Ancistrocladus abbreviatus]
MGQTRWGQSPKIKVVTPDKSKSVDDFIDVEEVKDLVAAQNEKRNRSQEAFNLWLVSGPTMPLSSGEQVQKWMMMRRH